LGKWEAQGHGTGIYRRKIGKGITFEMYINTVTNKKKPPYPEKNKCLHRKQIDF